MNILAHLFLSGNSQEIQLGNFIGDFIKGKEYQYYPDNIALGIILHRKIDHYTDTNPATTTIKQSFLPFYQHYSGIIVDILYDHFLAKNWNKYMNIPLDQFLTDFYSFARTQADIMPEEVNQTLFRLKHSKRIESYQTLEGIQKSLELMSQHTSLPAKASLAISTIQSNYHIMENISNNYIEHIKELYPNWIAQLSLQKVN